MKNGAIVLGCVIGAVVAGNSARAVTERAPASAPAVAPGAAVAAVAAPEEATGNPYDSIVGRNVFGLKPPPPPPAPPDPDKLNPPPTIELQGLTTINGRPQVLFKAKLPAKPPAPAQDASFVMSAGERQGEIEVVEINERDGVVKFNNHGRLQELNMKDNAAKPVAGAAIPALPIPGAPPGVPPPAAAAFNPVPPASPAGTTLGGGRTIPTTGLPSRPLRASTDLIAGGVPQAPQNTQAERPLSHEERELMIEGMRKYYTETGDVRGPVMPPTSLSQPSQEPTPPH